MAVEARRGCGFRKVGGLYLVAPSGGMPCCKLPWPLTVCPTCKAGIKPTRGWAWVEPKLLEGPCKVGQSSPADKGHHGSSTFMCPVADPAYLGEQVGLLWIGEAFYPNAASFEIEAQQMGISRRISAPPRGFKVGEHWVFLAHRHAVRQGNGEYMAGIFKVFKPTAMERIVKQSEFDAAQADLAALEVAAGKGETYELHEAGAKLSADRRRGITWVPVPDDDKDHQGSAHDDSGQGGLDV